MQNSIVPETGQVVYQVLDDLGTNGHVWPEMAENEANEQTIIQWIIDGQFKRPLRVIAFNTEEGGWSRDITHGIVRRILQLNHRGTPLGAAVVAMKLERNQ
jgi:hypothetical protein